MVKVHFGLSLPFSLSTSFKTCIIITIRTTTTIITVSLLVMYYYYYYYTIIVGAVNLAYLGYFTFQ